MVIFRPIFSYLAPAPFIPFNKKCWNIYVDKAYNISFISVSMNWSTVWQQGLPNISSKVHGDEMKVDSISNRNRCSYIWICKDGFLLNSLTWRLINNDLPYPLILKVSWNLTRVQMITIKLVLNSTSPNSFGV